jgi:hypothetical protein
MSYYDDSLAARQHQAIRTESVSGAYSPMRHCQGACKRRRSITQFAAGSDICIRCVNRAS